MRPLAVNVAQQAALYRGPTGVMPIWESVEIDDRERERERERVHRSHSMQLQEAVVKGA